jgi:hypothetical protein
MIGLFLLFCLIVAIIVGIIMVCYGVVVYIQTCIEAADYYKGGCPDCGACCNIENGK